jgi:hypothetical protein
MNFIHLKIKKLVIKKNTWTNKMVPRVKLNFVPYW